MNIIAYPLHIQEASLILTNQSALFWEQEKTLILSDLHLGKAAHFRKNGIALPGQLALQDLSRLDTLIRHYDAAKIIIVGDLIHAGANKEVHLFTTLRQQHPQRTFILIRGNHDRISEQHLNDIGIDQVFEEHTIHKLSFAHQPSSLNGKFVISGHIHPGVVLMLQAKKRMRFPCYLVNEHQLILPAFSRFTGLDTSRVPEGSDCYAFYTEGIFKVP
ncbi:phosphoesterase [Taibaiella sp. KBW10]|uniref:ligase-associated DNA damage response endonuclease PdeM n=1 Tax=Taibaiella sp. KBW10 TaxID=2153357 RepID=UPI000F59FB46|nr:ligase-associated DNA damage response endonuclease PdeM [Taibaiella sp. KBW10]RQO31140.1 phosphoesterase [Taibaiella sp. KBW10]